MELMQQLEIYTMAQKSVGTQFMLIGFGLLGIATLSYFMGESALSNGLKTGALVCGLVMLVGGFGYRNFSVKTQDVQMELLQKNEVEYQQVETERMAKVVKDYPMYQIVFGAFIIIALLVIWFVKNPYWHGVAFAVMIQAAAVMLSEAFSHQSIKAYFDYLSSL